MRLALESGDLRGRILLSGGDGLTTLLIIGRTGLHISVGTFGADLPEPGADPAGEGHTLPPLAPLPPPQARLTPAACARMRACGFTPAAVCCRLLWRSWLVACGRYNRLARGEEYPVSRRYQGGCGAQIEPPSRHEGKPRHVGRWTKPRILMLP